MIRTEKEHKAALQKLRQNEEALNKQREHLEAMQLPEEQVILALSPLKSFYHQLKGAIRIFEVLRIQPTELHFDPGLNLLRNEDATIKNFRSECE